MPSIFGVINETSISTVERSFIYGDQGITNVNCSQKDFMTTLCSPLKQNRQKVTAPPGCKLGTSEPKKNAHNSARYTKKKPLTPPKPSRLFTAFSLFG